MSGGWTENFPPVTSLVSYAALRHNPDPAMRALYDRAKNREDREAAAELIHRLVRQEGVEKVVAGIREFADRHPGAVLVSVHAIEGKGRNAIPFTLTNFIASQTDLEVDNTIVQSDIVSKTGVKSTWYRLAHRTQFEGAVQAGKEYIMVDDAFSAGGTFSELRQHIEQGGGKVVDTITLANGAKSMNADLAVTKGHILEMERKFGVESLQDFLKEEALYDGNHRALTDAEARTLLGSPSLDEARDRMAQARQEGIKRVRPQMVPGTSPDTEAITHPPETINRSQPEHAASHEAVFHAQKPSVSLEPEAQKQPDQNSRAMEQAKKAGYVQGVCECAALVGNQTIAKKLLTEMKVNKDMAKKYAGPETYKALEQGVFAPKPEHRRELTRSRGRSL